MVFRQRRRNFGSAIRLRWLLLSWHVHCFFGVVSRAVGRGEGGGVFLLFAAAGLAAAAGAGRSRAPERRRDPLPAFCCGASWRREERSGRTAHVLLGECRTTEFEEEWHAQAEHEFLRRAEPVGNLFGLDRL